MHVLVNAAISAGTLLKGNFVKIENYPVAVSSVKIVYIKCHCNYNGKAINNRASQKTCQNIISNHAFEGKVGSDFTLTGFAV